jgi:hypothetical protein
MNTQEYPGYILAAPPLHLRIVSGKKQKWTLVEELKSREKGRTD